MAFEKLEARAKSGRAGLPASISLTARGARPAVMVSLTRELVDGAAFDGAAKFDAMIGTGDDVGKIRIVQAVGGLLTPRVLRANSFLLDLGYVEAIGTEAHSKRFTSARVVETGVVEVDVPDFGDDDAPSREREEARGDVPPAPPEVTALVRKASAKAETVNGVTIDLAAGKERVIFRGKSVDVSPRQARLVYLLSRPRPTPVATSFLVGALWDGKPPGSAMTTLQQMAADLQKMLSPIGLNLAVVRGVGYQLKDL